MNSRRKHEQALKKGVHVVVRNRGKVERRTEMPEKLADAALDEAMARLDGWRLDREAGAIHRRFGFADFVEAFGFMTRVALRAQAMDHHPDWANSYNTVDITLSTHSAGGVSRNDIELARAIDGLAGKAG
jgi:4a-hydroxytetrahydrobiopterin dehydratase